MTSIIITIANIFIFSCTAPADYSDMDGAVIFPSGNVSQCITITVSDDDVLEGDEEFYVTVFTTDNDVIINNAVANISIADNDSMFLIYIICFYNNDSSLCTVVNISIPYELNIFEHDDFLLVCVSLMAREQIQRPVLVDIKTSDGSAES